jgi:MarR family transcriptional regulator, organic hydroperoxide resistance regulator
VSLSSTPAPDAPPLPAGAEAFSAAVDDFMRAARRARGRLAAEGDLSLSQYHLLEPLTAALGPLGVGELAAAAGVSTPTATRMLGSLERDGLVERHPCARDRRVVRVALTDDGATRVEHKRHRIAARRRELYDSLPADEREQAARLLARLAAAIEDLR